MQQFAVRRFACRLREVGARRLREGAQQHANKQGARLVSLEAARANGFKFDWTSYAPPKPSFLGVKTLKNFPLDGGALHRLGSVFPDLGLGRQYRTCSTMRSRRRIRAQCCPRRKCSTRLVKGRWLTANAVYGFWPANRSGDSIELYADESREAHCRFPSTAPAKRKTAEQSNLCGLRISSARAMFSPLQREGQGKVCPFTPFPIMGAFAVTTGIGCEDRVKAS